mmetsp:Transcript_10411/g.28672  ORF Transcript_10411/g.28672 Transcript_10411/m.28672 type:complete len:104 (+) Transcript_10411:68-379(+)
MYFSSPSTVFSVRIGSTRMPLLVSNLRGFNVDRHALSNPEPAKHHSREDEAGLVDGNALFWASPPRSQLEVDAIHRADATSAEAHDTSPRHVQLQCHLSAPAA